MSFESITRRSMLIVGGGGLLGGSTFAALRALTPVDNTIFAPISYSFADSGRCVLTAQAVEGPYYVDEALVRSDIREDRQGLATTLRLKIVDGATCDPLQGAAIDVWHCDANGNYSAAPQSMRDAHRDAHGHLQPASNARFLRGRQISGTDGIVEFTTIYPGWYQGRTPHIHLKAFVREREVATTQLFFSDTLSRAVYQTAPYASHGQPDVTNRSDMILNQARGADGSWPKIDRAQDAITATLTIGIKSLA
jgi:protocatechuate 3,4-dioxygenase beta subunit